MIQNIIPYALMFLSGAAALGYEMVWVRALSTGLGHEIVSVLAVLTAFFVGTAAGAWLLDHPIRNSRSPRAWYAALEVIIALWAVMLSLLIPKTAPLGACLMGVHPSAPLQWGVTFLLPLVLLLPATMAMGATLPAMECIVARLRRENRVVGGLYGANTLGAVSGCLATTFWVVPSVGFAHTQYLLAAVNLICALGIFGFNAGDARFPKDAEGKIPVAFSSNRLLLSLFFTGLLGIGFEVMTVRILGQVLENTVFSYAALLSVYLLGTAAGAAVYQGTLVNRPFASTLTGLLMAQAISCTAGMWVLRSSVTLYEYIGRMGPRAAEFGVSALVFLGPTLVMGALFSHLIQAAKFHRKGLGTALAVNTLGGAFAPYLFGILLMPSWGPARAMVTLCMGYLLLLPRVRFAVMGRVAGCAVAAGLMLTLSGPFDFIQLSPGEAVITHRHGIMAGVTVVRDARQEYHLKVNNHYQMGGTSSRYSDQRQAHIPILLHPNPQNVLFMGLGTGTTFATAGQYEGLKVDGLELIPEVVPLMTYFQRSALEMENKNLRVFTADARRFVLAGQQPYDVIIADLFHPSRDGAAFLYTKEHFSAVARRLSEDGIFCQWLPLYQMDLDLLRLIVRTFLDVFPQGTAFLAHHSLSQPIVGLIGGRKPIHMEAGILSRKMAAHPELADSLSSVGLPGIYTLLGCYLGEGFQLREFAGSGPLNTDDHPRVLFQAPEFVYTAAPTSPADRLLAVVQAFSPRAENILAPNATGNEKSRLTAYWQARNDYLGTGALVSSTADSKNRALQLVDPLLEIVRKSPDFEAAYRPLLAIAGRLHQQDPRMAEKLLMTLEAATPQRPEAGRMRLELSKGI